MYFYLQVLCQAAISNAVSPSNIYLSHDRSDTFTYIEKYQQNTSELEIDLLE